MASRRTVVASAVLGVLVVAGAGLLDGAQFSGIRWVPSFEPAPLPPAPVETLGTYAPSTPPPLPTGDADLAISAILLIALVAIAVIVVAVLLWRLFRNRPSRTGFGFGRLTGRAGAADIGPAPDEEADPDPPILRSGVEEALRLLESEREPGDAVMKAWLGLEQTAEESGILRRPAETATEYTSRIMSRVSTDDRAIRTLLSLYLRTRFGDRPVTAADVDRARSALQALADTWADVTPVRQRVTMKAVDLPRRQATGRDERRGRK